MDTRLVDVLSGKESNHLFPFFWIRNGKTDKLPERVQKVYESGCKGFCMESRTHEDFCGAKWWEDMKVILEEAKRRDMKVWILDDKHFPTGYANGILEKENNEKKKWFIREHHVDVIGPLQGSSVLIPSLQEDEKILTAVAYRRAGKGDELEDVGINLFEELKSGEDFLYWDVPEGFYRIFFVIKTRKGGRRTQVSYINPLSEESVNMLIDAVYEPHYIHLGEYFGNTLAGFFSDEPGFYSTHIGHWGYDKGEYNYTVGQPGVALPWDDDVVLKMEKHDVFKKEWVEKYKDFSQMVYNKLPLLWYSCPMRAPGIRLAYMDCVTQLWKERFSIQIGNWCRKHHVLYTGHVIEDMNAHMRIGSGAGHYFRSLGGQDISGIDIVLHQVLPGYAHNDAAGLGESGRVDCYFFHYVLPKLAVSLARIEPRMQGKAMCEVFGAYGWAETVTCMKWLVDYLLVRGINYFVPHAFTDFFPDPDCPPHFYAEGNNPQFAGFSELMRYTNKIAHLLEGAILKTEGAVLYPAEGEWMSSPQFRTMDECAKVLYDAHIDFDILPLEALEQAQVEEKKLWVNGNAHNFLVIPYAEIYPKKLWDILDEFEKKGLPVYRLQKDDNNFRQEMTEKTLVGRIWAEGLAHIYTEGAECLRIARFDRGSATWFMIFWEDISKEVIRTIKMPCKGKFLRLDFMSGAIVQDYTEDGQIEIHLYPYQSELLLFDHFAESFLDDMPHKEKWIEWMEPRLLWDISLKETGKDSDYNTVRQNSCLFSVTGKGAWPYFSGNIKYNTVIDLEEDRKVGIDLGVVGVTARLVVNDVDLGMRICPPYRWDLSGNVQCGKNKIEIEVANTLIHRVKKDRCSEFMQIGPSGLLGPVKLFQIK